MPRRQNFVKKTRHASPVLYRVALFLTSLGLAGLCLVFFYFKSNPEDAIVYSLLALVGLLFLKDINFQASLPTGFEGGRVLAFGSLIISLAMARFLHFVMENGKKMEPMSNSNLLEYFKLFFVDFLSVNEEYVSKVETQLILACCGAVLLIIFGYYQLLAYCGVYVVSSGWFWLCSVSNIILAEFASVACFTGTFIKGINNYYWYQETSDVGFDLLITFFRLISGFIIPAFFSGSPIQVTIIFYWFLIAIHLCLTVIVYFDVYVKGTPILFFSGWGDETAVIQLIITGLLIAVSFTHSTSRLFIRAKREQEVKVSKEIFLVAFNMCLEVFTTSNRAVNYFTSYPRL